MENLSSNQNRNESKEVQYLIPQSSSSSQVVMASDHVNFAKPIEDRTISRIASSGAISDMALSRRPSAIVTAMRRPSVQRHLLAE